MDVSAVFEPEDEHHTLFQTLKSIALTILVLWTIAANALVFVVLYKNPRLQTVPNLLVSRTFFFILELLNLIFTNF